MRFTYRLLKYTYTSYCQGTADRGVEYALVYAPEDASSNNVRSRLINQKQKEYDHEIDIDSDNYYFMVVSCFT